MVEIPICYLSVYVIRHALSVLFGAFASKIRCLWDTLVYCIVFKYFKLRKCQILSRLLFSRNDNVVERYEISFVDGYNVIIICCWLISQLMYPSLFLVTRLDWLQRNVSRWIRINHCKIRTRFSIFLILYLDSERNDEKCVLFYHNVFFSFLSFYTRFRPHWIDKKKMIVSDNRKLRLKIHKTFNFNTSSWKIKYKILKKKLLYFAVEKVYRKFATKL